VPCCSFGGRETLGYFEEAQVFEVVSVKGKCREGQEFMSVWVGFEFSIWSAEEKGRNPTMNPSP
jgi:hypothetical protein